LDRSSTTDNPSQSPRSGSGLSIFWYRNIQVDVPDSLAFGAALALLGGLFGFWGRRLRGHSPVIARLGVQGLARLCKSRRRGLCRRFLVSSGSLTALSGAGGVFGGPWRCLAGSLAFGGGGLEVIARLGVQDLARLCKCRRIGLWGRFLAPSESLTALSGAGGSLAGLGGVFGGAFYGRQGLWRRFLALA